MATAFVSEGTADPLRPTDGPPSRLASSGSNDVSASAPATRARAFSAPVKRVRRTLQVTQLQDYRYSDPVQGVETHLRLFPPLIRGTQRLLDAELRSAPLSCVDAEHPDAFGNRVFEVQQNTVRCHLTITAAFRVENIGTYDATGALVPASIAPEPDDRDRYLSSTCLTEAGTTLVEALAQLRTEDAADPATDPLGFAVDLCSFIFRQMRYAAGATTIATTATEAWGTRAGVCQDYAHVFLTLCRMAGLPARYVSGFLPGEGAMHAWVEVLADTEGRPGWYALDPTHDCWVDERYVSVAAGRDYQDIVPNSGTYYGMARNVLRHCSRVQVEASETELVTP